MRYYEATSTIASSPEAVLTDGAAWPSWDSGVDGVDRIARGLKRRVEAGH